MRGRVVSGAALVGVGGVAGFFSASLMTGTSTEIGTASSGSVSDPKAAQRANVMGQCHHVIPAYKERFNQIMK